MMFLSYSYVATDSTRSKMVLAILFMMMMTTRHRCYNHRSTRDTDIFLNVEAFQALHRQRRRRRCCERTLPSSLSLSSSRQRSTAPPNGRRIHKSTKVHAINGKGESENDCDDKITDDDELVQVPPLTTMEALEQNLEEQGEEPKSVSSLSLKGIISKIVNLLLDIWGAGIMVLGIAFTFGLLLNIMGYGYRFSTTEFLHIDTLDNIRTERQFEIIERRYERERIQKMKKETLKETTETTIPLTSTPSTLTSP